MKALVIGCGRVGSALAQAARRVRSGRSPPRRARGGARAARRGWRGGFVLGHGMDVSVLERAASRTPTWSWSRPTATTRTSWSPRSPSALRGAARRRAHPRPGPRRVLRRPRLRRRLADQDRDRGSSRAGRSRRTEERLMFVDRRSAAGRSAPTWRGRSTARATRSWSSSRAAPASTARGRVRPPRAARRRHRALRAGAGRASSARPRSSVAATGDDEDNIVICQLARDSSASRRSSPGSTTRATSTTSTCSASRPTLSATAMMHGADRARGARARARAPAASSARRTWRSSRSRSRGRPAAGQRVEELQLPGECAADLGDARRAGRDRVGSTLARGRRPGARGPRAGVRARAPPRVHRRRERRVGVAGRRRPLHCRDEASRPPRGNGFDRPPGARGHRRAPELELVAAASGIEP